MNKHLLYFNWTVNCVSTSIGMSKDKQNTLIKIIKLLKMLLCQDIQDPSISY